MQPGSLARPVALSAIELSAGTGLVPAEIFVQTPQNVAVLPHGAAAYKLVLRLGLWFCTGTIVLASALCIGIGGIVLVEVVMAISLAASKIGDR